MDIQARKTAFVQEFLKLQSEEIITHLENFLKLEKEISLEPMTTKELNSRIDKSELDFENGKFKSNSELLSKY
jgi:hypothetical protein